MRKFIAALALISLIAIPSLTVTANAAPRVPVEFLVREQRLLTISGGKRAFLLAA